MRGVGSHALRHVEGDDAVAEVASVGLGNDRRGRVHLRHALLHLEGLDHLTRRGEGELCGLLGCDDV